MRSTLTATSAAIVLTFGSASAQDRSGGESYTLDRGGDRTESQSTAASRDRSGEDYSVVIWDPLTGSWAYVTEVDLPQPTDRSEHEAAQSTRRDEDRQQSAADDRTERRDRSPAMRRDQGREEERQAGFRQDRERGDRPASYTRETGSSLDRGWRETSEPRSGRDPRTGARGHARFEGEVQGFREVTLRRGETVPEEHTWVRIRMEGGSDRIIDLGRRKDLSDLDLQRGDRVKVTGRESSISGQTVLLADRIQIGNETVNIDRGKNRQQVSGTVRDYRRMDLSGEGDEHLVVRLQLQDGETVIADLGRNASLEELNIDPQTQVRLQGERKEIDGRQVLVAKKIVVDGDKTRLRQDQGGAAEGRRDRE